jgi:hypothetical protein
MGALLSLPQQFSKGRWHRDPQHTWVVTEAQYIYDLASSCFIDHEAVSDLVPQWAQRLNATQPAVCAVYLLGAWATGKAGYTA